MCVSKTKANSLNIWCVAPHIQLVMTFKLASLWLHQRDTRHQNKVA